MTVVTRDHQALLLRRAKPFEFWQSVTGSVKAHESHAAAARRELEEETGLGNEGTLVCTGVSRQFVIDPRWRHRFVAGAAENVEFEWRYWLDEPVDVCINPKEHSEARWLPLADAIVKTWSWTNKAALESLRR